MTKNQALRLALEALENIDRAMPFPVAKLAIKECKAALEAKDEPFGFFQYDIRLDAWVQNRINNKGVAFYTLPPQRIPQDVPQIPQEDSSNESAYQRGYLDGMAKRPQPLTNEQLKAIVSDTVDGVTVSESVLFRCVARAVEHAHGIIGEYK
jgi:hypothetical protein